MNHRRFRLAACVALLGMSATPGVCADHYAGSLSFRGDVMPLRIEIDDSDGEGMSAWLDLPQLLMSREPMASLPVDGGVQLTFPFGIGDFIVNTEQLPSLVTRELGGDDMVLELSAGSPPPYSREPVAFESDGLRLEGALYLPAGSEPHPAVALLHGAAVSGLDDWAYRSWADWLSRHGLAVLAWNKRPFADAAQKRPADMAQLAGDAAAAVRWLRSRDDVDPRRIGLLGGSQGAWVALQVAARVQGIAFLVLNSVAAVPPWRQQMQEVEWGMRDDGMDEMDIDSALAYLGLYFDVVHSGQGWERLEVAARLAQEHPWGQYVDQPRSLDDLAWWRANCCFQPADAASSLQLPVLAFYGGRDWIVPPIENADRLPALFPDPSRISVHVLPGADHRLELPMGPDVSGQWRWPRMADELFPVFETWLAEHELSP